MGNMDNIGNAGNTETNDDIILIIKKI